MAKQTHNEQQKEDVVRGAWHPYLGFLGALLAPSLLLLFRIFGETDLDESFACTIVFGFWLAIAAIVARESRDSVSHVKEMFCEGILQDQSGLMSMFCRSQISTFLSAIFFGAIFSMLLLMFTYTMPAAFFVALFAGALVFVGLRILSEGVFERHVKRPLGLVMRRFAVTSLIAVLLTVGYFITIALSPAPDVDANPQAVSSYVIETVSHDCKFFQDLVRTSAYIDTNIGALRNVPQITGWVPLALFASLLSIVPMVGFVMTVRFGYEALSRKIGK